MAKIENTAKVIALGLFDSIHLGHKEIILKTKSVAENLHLKSALMTFDDGFFVELNRETKQIFTLKERLSILKEFNLDEIVIIDDCKNFLMLSPIQFFSKLKEMSVVHIVCGRDYTFGKNAEGNTENIVEFAQKFDIEVTIVDLIFDNSEKISSTLIRKALANGENSRVNRLLGRQYFIFGEVKIGRKQGRIIGTPTANIILDKIKLLPKLGVYSTETLVKGKIYQSITNVGGQPTFNLANNITVETFILNYNDGEMFYGENAIVFFNKFIREIIKFDNAEQLQAQIQKDINNI